MGETSLVDLKNIWNVNSDYKLLDSLVNDLIKNKGKKIKYFLHLPIHLPFIKSEIEKLPKSAKILEAGCGFGHWVFWMAKHNFQVTGVDIAEKTIETAKLYAKNKKISNCKFVVADIRKLPLEDNSFDMIFSFGVIEHFKNPKPLMLELKRVLKPGGKIFLSVPNIYSMHSLTRPMAKLLGRWNLGYESSYNQDQLKNLFTDNGFKVTQCGIMPGGEFFGSGVRSIPIVGKTLFRILTKISFVLENKQGWLGFWLYGTAIKVIKNK